MTTTHVNDFVKLEITAALGQCIQALGTVPSGELYTRVMNQIDLETYTECIARLRRAKLVVQTPGYMLRWTGPTDIDHLK